LPLFFVSATNFSTVLFSKTKSTKIFQFFLILG
jgi:hypothetical protein